MAVGLPLHGQELQRLRGMHPFTNIPLGTLADAPTRQARTRAKEVFNPIWQSQRMTRSEAYSWLAGQLGIANVEECHIGWFDVQTCQRVVVVCQQLAKEAKRMGVTA